MPRLSTWCFPLLGVLHAAAVPAAPGDTVWSQLLDQGNGTPHSRLAGDPGNWRRMLRLDGAGRLLVVGSTSNAAPAGYDWRIAKLDGGNGSVLWSQVFDAGAGDDHPYALALDAAGNAVVVGSVRDAGGKDRWRVRKLAAASGALIWEQDFAGAMEGAARLVEVDGAGNVVVAGQWSNGGDLDIRVLSLNGATGLLQWQRDLAGDGGPDVVNALVLDSVNRDALLAGSVRVGGIDQWLVARLAAATGTLLWQDRRSLAQHSIGRDLIIDEAGKILVAGVTNYLPGTSRPQSANPWVIKYEAFGSVLWSRSYGSLGNEIWGEALTLLQAPGNEVLVGGYRRSFPVIDAWMARLAADGAPLWDRAPTGPREDRHHTLALGPDGHVLSASQLPDFNRMVLRKYNSRDGGLYWGGSYVSTSHPWIPASVLASGDAMWVYGTLQDPGTSGAPTRLHLRRIHNPHIGNEPSQFLFAAQEVTPGTLAQSGTATISGFVGSLPVAVDQGEYSIGCAGVFTSANGTITAGQTLCLRHTASTTVGEMRQTQVAVGTTAAFFKTTAKWPTTAGVAITPDTIGYSHSFFVTGTVSSPHGTPTGQVSWDNGRVQSYRDDGTPVYAPFCVSTNLVSGRADCSRQALQVGNFQVRTVYPGDAQFQASTSAPTPFNVVPAGGQFVDFPAIADQPIATELSLATRTLAGLEARIVSLTPATCSVDGNVFPRLVRMLAIGSCTLRADHPGGVNYEPAPPVDQSFRIKHLQQIAFGALADRVFGDPPLALQATGGTGPAISFSSQTAATCSTGGAQGATLSLLAAGTCTVAADQAGDDTHFAAAQVLRSFAIAPAPQQISFAAIADRLIGSPAFAVTASGGGSGLPVRFSTRTPSTCASSRRDGATITLLGLGTCTIAADQAATANYTAASAERSFAVLENEVTVDVSRQGNGRVTAAGIDCGSDCSGTLRVGTLMTLIAQPAANWAFAGWNAGCDQVRGNRCRIAPRAARAVEARFVARVDPARADFDGNGHPDLLYRDASGTLHLLALDAGGEVLADHSVAAADPAWRVRGIADFDADGDPDLLWREASGDLRLWTFQGIALQAQAVLFRLDAGSDVAAVADFDGDHDPDLLLRDANGGLVLRWLAGLSPAGQQALFAVAPNWRVEAAADLDGDLQPDLLLRDTQSGKAHAWATRYDANAARLDLVGAAQPVPDLPPGWDIVQAQDRDGDLQADLLLQRRSDGAVLWLVLDRRLRVDDRRLPAIQATWRLEPLP